MSTEHPNEYERAIENYAASCRDVREMENRLKVAQAEFTRAQQSMQTAWRVIIQHVADGHTKPGVYRINKGPGPFAEAIVIGEGDYPELKPMFR